MTQNRYVASKRDIIIFFIISIFYSVIYIYPYYDFSIIACRIFTCCLYLPELVAIIINVIIKYGNIKNEKVLKVTKILFNMFTFIHFTISGFLVYLAATFDW